MKKLIAIGVFILFLVVAFTQSMTSQNLEIKSIKGCMKIDFFEQFPTEENLSKASLIDFPSTIYIAANSLEEYKIFENTLNLINPNLTTGYWPMFEKSYYLSPFSYTYEIEKLIDELKQNNQEKKLKILLDLELPRNRLLWFKNVFSFHKNKQLIKQIFLQSESLNIEIYTSEYPAPFKSFQTFFQILGISYPLSSYPHKMIVMYYSKMIEIITPFLVNHIKKQIVHNYKLYGEDFHVAIGLTAKGFEDITEKYIISPEILDRDLGFLADNGIKNVTIFRLAGLNESYINVIKKYV